MPALSSGNRKKNYGGAVIAILAYDSRFFEHLPKLFHNPVGSTKRLREFAAQVGRRWLQGHQASGSSFT